MDNLIGFLFFVSFLSLIVGIINPGVFKNIFKSKEVNRKFILKTFGLVTVILFFVLGMFAEPVQKPENQEINNTESSSSAQIVDNKKEINKVVPTVKKIENKSKTNSVPENIVKEDIVNKIEPTIILPAATALKIEENLPEPVISETIVRSETVQEVTPVKESPVVSVPVYLTYVPVVEAPVEVSDSCCKHCTKGKACGDSCISRSYICHKGPGCACDY